MLRRLILVLLSLSLILTAVACNGNNGAVSDNTKKTAQQLEGKVVIDGSGTVYPLMAHIAEEYMTYEQTKVSVQVGRAGSSAGFKKFIAGETDFSDASRAIKKEEAEQLEAQGLKLGEQILEIKLALDGLTIVINKENTWAREMTSEEIINMYISGTYNSDDIVKWSDIRAAWPEEQIKFYGPNENHGTYEFFWEVILGKKDLVKTVDLQQEYSTLVDLVANDRNAIAFFGFGYYAGNMDKISAVSIDFGDGPVEPSLETIGEDLGYKYFTRPVYTYLNVSHINGNPQILDYAKYVVSPDGALRLAGENGFAPLSDEQYEEYYKWLESIN